MSSIMTTVDGKSITVRDEYATMISLYNLNMEAYDGLGGFIDGARIWGYPRETTESLERRKKICYYPNFPKAVADTVEGHLFKQKINRQTDDAFLTDWVLATNKLEDITMDELMQKAFISAQNCGHSYILVDKPMKQSASKAEEMKDGKPYAYVLNATEVVDWYKDEFGEFVWVKILETYIDNGEDPTAVHDIKTRTRIWTRFDTYIFDADAKTATDRVAHSLKIVPIVQVYNNVSMTMPDIGTTEMTPIVQLSWALFNRLSELDQLLRNNTFPSLAWPGDLPGQEAATNDTSSEKNIVSIGAASIMSFDSDAKHPPAYLSPGSDCTEAYYKVIQMLIDMIWEQARLAFTTGVKSSGVAMAFEFEKTNQSLLRKAARLADAEKKILTIASKWMGKDDPGDITITYPKDFNLRDMDRELEQAFKALQLGISEKFDKQYKKFMSRQIMPAQPPETQDEIDTEIDTAEEVAPIENFDNEGDDE